MEIAHILKTLWRLRLLVVLVALLAAVAGYATAFKPTLPPTFESRSIEFGAASTQVLVDGGVSPLVDLAQDVSPLATRAQIFTRLVMSDPAQAAIAEEAGRPLGSFVISSELESSGTRSSREAGSEERANEVSGEAVVSRIMFAAEEELPVISVYSQAPTAEEATRLADAGAKGLMTYLATLQSENGKQVPAATAVRPIQLGPARGSLVNPGASVAVAAMAFLGVFIVGCIMLIVLANVADALRQQSPRARALAPVRSPSDSAQGRTDAA